MTKSTAEREERAGGDGGLRREEKVGEEFPRVRGRSLTFIGIENGFSSGYRRREGREERGRIR